MKQFAFGAIYCLVGLTFLVVSLRSVSEIEVENGIQAVNIVRAGKPAKFSSETPAAPETELQSDDPATMVQKVNFAQQVLEEFWQNTFAQFGGRFYSPRVILTNGATYTQCGLSRGAGYCGADHVIHLDANFLYQQMDMVSRQLGTDGDMGAIVVIAHEYGHSVQRQAPIFSRLTELNADCMAGAFTRYSERRGFLDANDITEAQRGLANNPENSVWFNAHSHGTSQERVGAFNQGYSYGIGSCR